MSLCLNLTSIAQFWTCHSVNTWELIISFQLFDFRVHIVRLQPFHFHFTIYGSLLHKHHAGRKTAVNFLHFQTYVKVLLLRFLRSIELKAERSSGVLRHACRPTWQLFHGRSKGNNFKGRTLRAWAAFQAYNHSWWSEPSLNSFGNNKEPLLFWNKIH